MDRRQTRIICTLLALSLIVAPISGMAMQVVMTGSDSSHCQGLESEPRVPQYENLDHAQCVMESCQENCGTSRYCSGQAPIILTQGEAPNYFGEHGFSAEPIDEAHLSIDRPSLYRPPRTW